MSESFAKAGAIGAALRQHYDAIASEPVPPSLARVLDEIEALPGAPKRRRDGK